MGLPTSLRDAFGRLQLCRRCKGRGSVDVTVTDAAGRRSEARRCPRCDGRGVVDVPAGGLGL